MSDKFSAVPIFDANQPVLGSENFPRQLAATVLTMSTGLLRMAFFTCRRTVTYTGVSIDSGTTAAAATPSLVRIGVWQENADGSISLVGSTPNDTTLLAAALTPYPKALSASVTFTDGYRYSVGVLVVTATTAPNIAGSSVAQASASRAPRLTAQIASQSDLPSSVTAATMATSLGGGMPYVVFT